MSSIIVLGPGAGMVDLLRAAAPEHDIHDLPHGEIGIIHSFRFIESPPELIAAHVPKKRTAGYEAPGRARHKKGKR